MSWLRNLAEGLIRGRHKSDSDQSRSTIPKNSKEDTKRQQRKDKAPPKSQVERRYIARFDGLIDIVAEDGRPVFLVSEQGKLETVDKIVIKGRTLLPPPVDKTPFLLVDADQVQREYEIWLSGSAANANREVFEAVRSYLGRLSDLPTPEHYDLCAAWVIHTYRLEEIQCSPIIWLFAVPERGKTRTGKGMAFAAYRGLHVESLNPAYILRVARDWGGTLFIDVVDVWRRAVKSDSMDILLHRFQPGTKVPRVLYPEKGPIADTDYFIVFGPTILGTNRGVDPTLESRSIQIVMQETNRRFQNTVTPDTALPVRTKLLAYRAYYLGKPLPPLPREFDGRFGELVQPLSQIVQEVAPDHMAELSSLFHRLEQERISSKSESFEATILRALAELSKEVVNGLLTVKRITDKINSDRPESKRLTPQKIGRVLKSLGLRTTRATRNGASAMNWENQKLTILFTKYGLEEPSETSESSVTSECRSGSTDVSDVSEVSDPLDLPF